MEFEIRSQDLRQSEDDKPMGHRPEHFLLNEFGLEKCMFRAAARAETSRLAAQRQELEIRVLSPTGDMSTIVDGTHPIRTPYSKSRMNGFSFVHPSAIE